MNALRDEARPLAIFFGILAVVLIPIGIATGSLIVAAILLLGTATLVVMLVAAADYL